jgi:hypothetical protein
MMAVLHLFEASEHFSHFGFSYDTIVLRELDELLR